MAKHMFLEYKSSSSDHLRMIKNSNICIALKNQLSKLPARLLYEKGFVEMNKVALTASGCYTSTYLKLLPLHKCNMPNSQMTNQNLSIQILYLHRSLSVHKEKGINSYTLLEFDLLS